jgi:hypothetical protein
MTRRHGLLVGTAWLAFVCCVGCDNGPEVAPVTGVVTQDGEPLEGGMVEFQPDFGAPSYGYTDETGRYEIQYQTDQMGALLGHHYVSVTTSGERTDPKTDTTVNVPELVPQEYNEETTLEYEVSSGKNTFDIAIEGKRKRGRSRN